MVSIDPSKMCIGWKKKRERENVEGGVLGCRGARGEVFASHTEKHTRCFPVVVVIVFFFSWTGRAQMVYLQYYNSYRSVIVFDSE